MMGEDGRRAKGSSCEAEGLTGLPVLDSTDELDEEGLGEGKLPRLERKSQRQQQQQQQQQQGAGWASKCWTRASPWAWAMAVAADTTLQLGLWRLDRQQKSRAPQRADNQWVPDVPLCDSSRCRSSFTFGSPSSVP
jgi:hypothetical protein